MNFKTGLSLLVGSAVLLAACSTWHKDEVKKRGVAGSSVNVWSSDDARIFRDDELAKFASSSVMNVKNARLITDNTEALQSKMKIIGSATKTLSLVYYIYADDFSSSAFSRSVLAAAMRGVKVSILVDFITNYERLDLFKYMEKYVSDAKAKTPDSKIGSLTVRFYGLPAPGILKASVFQTVPCDDYNPDQEDSESCKHQKEALIAKMGNPDSTWFSKMYLTGLYGKNNVLLGTSTQLGGRFNPAALKSMNDPNAKKPSPEEMKKIGGLLKGAFIEDSFKAKFKLGIALSSHGEALGPIVNEFTGRLPLSACSGKDCDHLTDYTHHKLIVADGARFQLGGRNVEDSYHSVKIKEQLSESRGKYTFIDTDFYAETPGAAEVEAAYQRLFAFSAMVGGLSQVEKYVPNEYDANIEAFQAALQSCLASGSQDPEACVNAEMPKQASYKSLPTRLATVSKNMDENAKRYKDYKPVVQSGLWNPAGDILKDSDAQVYYLENLSFNKGMPSERLYGSKIGKENENGKGIHAAWVRGLENACAVSTKTGVQKRVIFHSAYFFMPTNLTNAIAKALNGTWDCSRVQIEIITNSLKTTDLAPINIFARYQLMALIKYNWEHQSSAKKAKLSFYEYLDNQPMTQNRSLHTKLSVLGDDMIIGSANSDVRSYYMDTNNGVYIRNAPQLIADYTAFIDRLKAEGSNLHIWPGAIELPQFNEKGEIVGIRLENYANATHEMFELQNEIIIAQMQARWDSEGTKLSPERKVAVKKHIAREGKKIQELTSKILESSGNTSSEEELDSEANKFDDYWKTL